MNPVSIGDLARLFQGRQLAGSLKANLTRLSREMTTGLRDDISSALSGDFGPMADIERLLTTVKSRQTSASEAAFVTEAMQTSLESIQENGRALNSALLTVRDTDNATTRQAIAQNARERFSMLTDTLNTNIAGRTLFGGGATDRAAIASASDMLAALKAATAAETNADGVIAVVDDWFDTPGGGFETSGYLGSDTPMAVFQFGAGDRVQPDFRADDPALREVMKGFALAALVGEGTLAGNPTGQIALLRAAGERMVNADQALTSLRAELGLAQERIEDADTRLSAEQTSLELARNQLIAVDPYEAASELEATYSQLETFYTVTSRLARLNFTDFMR